MICITTSAVVVISYGMFLQGANPIQCIFASVSAVYCLLEIHDCLDTWRLIKMRKCEEIEEKYSEFIPFPVYILE